jgi:hypothetical protein
MNGKGITIAGFAALIGALALNGKAALEAVMGLPKVLQAFATGLPFGLASFLIALSLASLVYYHARQAFAYGKGGPSGRDFRITLLSLVVACAATMAQAMVMRGDTSGALLMALMLGILAGLLAPLIVQGLVSLRRQVKS